MSKQDDQSLSCQYQQLLPLLNKLSAYRQKKLLRLLGYADDQTSCILTPGAVLHLLFTNLLATISPLTGEQQEILTEAFLKEIVSYGQDLSEHKVKVEANIGLVSVLDRTYAVISGKDGFLDLGTGNIIPSIKLIPLEAITYNLCQVYHSSLSLVNKKT